MDATANGSASLFDFGRLRWRRSGRKGAATAVQPEADDTISHGLSEDQLRDLIAQDLRACIRRPMAPPPGATRAQPFLLDRLVQAGV